MTIDNDGSTINKVELIFTIYNKSKKNCIITDVLAKIYENDSYTPDDDIFHITHLKSGENIHEFTILYVAANETSTFDIELGDNLPGRSKKRFQKGRSYTIEMYCVINNRKVKIFSRSESFTITEMVDNCIKLKSINKTITRGNFEKKIQNIRKQIHYHNGIIYRFLADCHNFIKYKVLRRPIWVVIDIFQWVLLRPYFLYIFLKNKILSNTIFILYGRKTYKTSVVFTEQEGRINTIEPLKELTHYLAQLIEKINKRNISNKISLEIKNTEINIIKNEMKLHIYLQGGENILVQELCEGSEIFLEFNYSKNYLFNYWHYNKKIINLREMATIILNYFIDWSLYKKPYR
jgi:dihydrofolate reductase